MKIAVLGCGPAGLMAVHGICSMIGQYGLTELNVKVFSRKRPSQLFGAQYLHWPIPGMTPNDPVMVNYVLQGTADDYRRKVYGRMWDGKVSPEDLSEPHLGWDIRSTYLNLWATYAHIIEDTWLDPLGIRAIMENHKPDIIINSVPRDGLCYRGHIFGGAEIWAAGDAPDMGIDVNSMYPCPDDTVVCNGDPQTGFYRKSRVFGHTTVEWPGSLGRVPIATASKVLKPTYTDCDCWPTVKHVGRYGTWSKTVLSHEAYKQARQIVREKIDASA